MYVSPYLYFNGNCAEAIALYEKAFNVQAHAMRYKDAPASEGYQAPSGTEDWIMHANMNIGNGMIMLCDAAGIECSFANGINIHVGLDSEEATKAAFNALKDGGEVTMELGDTFWSSCFGTVKDKFGVYWMISAGEKM